MNSKNILLRTGLWYTISNFVSQGIVFLCTPIFTRILTKADFGEFNNFVAALNIFVIVLTLNLDATYISAKRDYEDENTYLSTVLKMSSVTVLAGALFCGVFQNWICNALSVKPLYLWLMLIYIFFYPAINLLLAKARFQFKYVQYILLNSGLGLVSTIAAIVLVCSCEDALLGRILGYAVPTIVVGVVCYVYIIFHGKKMDFGMCKYALKIGLPYIPHLLSMTFLNFIDRIMITKMCNEDATAIYSLGYSCATIIVVLMTSYNSAFSPWLTKKLEQNEEDIKKISFQYVLWFLLPVFGVLLLVPELIYVLGGPEYKDAVMVALVVSVGVVFQFIYTMYVNVEQYYKKTIGMAIASVLAALLNLILNYIFIPMYGYQVAAFTTLIGYMFLFVMHMLLVHRMKKNHLYPTGKIIVTAGIAFLMMIIYLFLYQYVWVRYVIVLLYAMIVFIFIRRNKRRFQC